MSVPASVIDPKIPAHVPPELVMPYKFVMGQTSTARPHDLVAEIHTWPRVFWSTDVFPGFEPAWVLRRAEDLRRVYLDNENFTVKEFAPWSKLCGEKWDLIPVEIDPPKHSSYRAMATPLFAPKRVNELDERVRQCARDYILSFRDAGECEFMSKFAFEFPIRVFLELMDLPLDLTGQFLTWEMGMLHATSTQQMMESTQAVVRYLRQIIAERKANPGKDLISYSTQVEVDGKPMSDDELLGYAFNLFIGGLDTVSTNMGLHFRHLAEHPGQQQQLRDNPALIPDAIEEMMRAYAAVTTFRTCTKPVEIQGVQILPGDKVAMATHLAARDPEEYENPDEIRFDRHQKHLGFGFGAHLCLGIHLARREMKVALEQFLELVPPFRIKPGVEIESHMALMIQPITLPLVWEAPKN